MRPVGITVGGHIDILVGIGANIHAFVAVSGILEHKMLRNVVRRRIQLDISARGNRLTFTLDIDHTG